MPPRRRPANFSSVSQAAAIIKQPSASMKDKAAALRYLAESGNYPDPTGPPPQSFFQVNGDIHGAELQPAFCLLMRREPAGSNQGLPPGKEPGTLSVAELKAALRERHVSIAGCTEKSELVALLEEALPEGSAPSQDSSGGGDGEEVLQEARLHVIQICYHLSHWDVDCMEMVRTGLLHRLLDWAAEPGAAVGPAKAAVAIRWMSKVLAGFTKGGGGAAQSLLDPRCQVGLEALMRSADPHGLFNCLHVLGHLGKGAGMTRMLRGSPGVLVAAGSMLRLCGREEIAGKRVHDVGPGMGRISAQEAGQILLENWSGTILNLVAGRGGPGSEEMEKGLPLLCKEALPDFSRLLSHLEPSRKAADAKACADILMLISTLTCRRPLDGSPSHPWLMREAGLVRPLAGLLANQQAVRGLRSATRNGESAIESAINALANICTSKDLTLEQAKQVRKDGGWEALAECCSERWSWVARVEAMTGLGNMFIVTPKEGLRVAEKRDVEGMLRRAIESEPPSSRLRVHAANAARAMADAQRFEGIKASVKDGSIPTPGSPSRPAADGGVLSMDECAMCGAAAESTNPGGDGSSGSGGERPGNKLKKCAACRSVAYCSAGCQKSHWKQGHKADCKQLLRALEEREAAAAALEQKRKESFGQATMLCSVHGANCGPSCRARNVAAAGAAH